MADADVWHRQKAVRDVQCYHEHDGIQASGCSNSPTAHPRRRPELASDRAKHNVAGMRKEVR